MANPTVVQAYLRLYTRTQLEEALRNALADHAAGVTITSTSFGDGQTSGQISGRPEEVIAILETALQTLDGTTTANAPLAAAVGFSQRRVE
jgi:hypothetical protein